MTLEIATLSNHLGWPSHELVDIAVVLKVKLGSGVEPLLDYVSGQAHEVSLQVLDLVLNNADGTLLVDIEVAHLSVRLAHKHGYPYLLWGIVLALWFLWQNYWLQHHAFDLETLYLRHAEENFLVQ